MDPLLHDREWSGMQHHAAAWAEVPERMLCHDAILLMDDPWILSFTKHRIMMAFCFTGQMVRAIREIEEWEAWLKRVGWCATKTVLVQQAALATDAPDQGQGPDGT